MAITNDAFAAAARRITQLGGAGGIGGLGLPNDGPRGIAVVPEGQASFGETLKKAINEVSGAQDTAADYAGKFMRGEPVELHQVMAATEEAGIALETMVEIRNKFADAYRTLVNMQS